MICKSYGWSEDEKVALDGPQKDTWRAIGMICKSYGWSVKRYG